MGYRNIPAFGDVAGNPCATEVRQPGEAPAKSMREDRGKPDDNLRSTPSDAFSDLEYTDSGFLKNVAKLFTAVGRARKDIKQGNAKTFD
jgi:hypothetical protein